MFDPENITKREAALAWLATHPNATPWSAALEGHTVTQADVDAARANANGTEARTPWQACMDAVSGGSAAADHIARNRGIAHVFGARRDRRDDDNPPSAA